MYRIAVLGNRDSIYGLAALGLATFPTDSLDHEETVKLLRRLAEGDYAVIYVTEALMSTLTDEINRYQDRQLPAIIPIPGVSGNTGAGVSGLKKLVEQAVGSDIIFMS